MSDIGDKIIGWVGAVGCALFIVEFILGVK
jgi:hypothetical protein